MRDVSQPDEHAGERLSLTGRGAWILALLLLVNVANFVDRQLPFILITSIKADLQLSDSQIALMAGLAFAVVYSFASLPLALAADRWNPRWVLAGSLAIWSAMTGLSGLVTNFVQLVLCRAGVAASEAGATPSAHALIARYMQPRVRALALAIFSLGVPIGSMLGLVLGGWINDVLDWRAAFFVVGLPGLILAGIAWFVLPDPPRHAEPVDGEAQRAPSFMTTLGTLWSIPSMRYMAVASAFYACGSYAINVFAPAFLMRVHGMSSSAAGLGMGVVFGVGGLIGTFAGGWFGDRLARRSEAWRLRVPAIGQALSLPTALGAWLVADPVLAVALLTVSYMFGLLYFAPTFAAAQSLVPDRIRATTSATLLFCLTIVGSSVGPLVVGWISDALEPQYGELSLRYAMCSMAVTMALSALFFYLGSRRISRDVAARQAFTSS
jgi:predicted MFS family arabinose efflux permease